MTKKTTVSTPQIEKPMVPDPASEAEALEAALAADQSVKASEAAPKDQATPEPIPEAKPKADAPVGPAGAGIVKQKKATPPQASSSFNETIAAKRAARDAAIAKAESELAPPPEPTEDELASIQRQEEIQDELEKVASEIDEATAFIEKMKTRARELMAELYPHTVKSDLHVDAVRGYLKSCQNERENRGAHPARLKELLTRAGLAPIDAAMARSRSRGAGRPRHSVKTPNTGGKE